MNIVHKIIQGDCLEVMKKIPDNTVDFICSDFFLTIGTIRGDSAIVILSVIKLHYIFSVFSHFHVALKINFHVYPSTLKL